MKNGIYVFLRIDGRKAKRGELLPSPATLTAGRAYIKHCTTVKTGVQTNAIYGLRDARPARMTIGAGAAAPALLFHGVR